LRRERSCEGVVGGNQTATGVQGKARQGVYMCTRRKTNAEEGRAGTKVETVRSDDEEDAHMGRL
jgi:hypothetical protein